MFLLGGTTHPYDPPWEQALGARVRELLRGELRVAYYYELPDGGTFRYRVYNMIQALHGARDVPVSACYFTADEAEALFQELPEIDVLVVCRVRYSAELGRIVSRARDLGKRVLYDIDDLVFDPDYVHLFVTALDFSLGDPKIWDTWFGYIGRMGAALKLCDSVLTTNHYLAERVRACFGKPTAVIPNFLNDEQLAISEPLFAEKQARSFARDGRIHLGYFSGSATHNKDFEIAAAALARVLDREPRAVVRIVGLLQPRGLERYADRIEVHPLTDFLNLQRLIASTEINLVPLQSNPFTECKSELKYFESAIVGTVTIASPSFTLRGAIRDGDNGYLARAFEWQEKIEHVLATLDDYPAMAERAFVDARARYSGPQLRERVLTAVLGEHLPQSCPSPPPPGQLPSAARAL